MAYAAEPKVAGSIAAGVACFRFARPAMTALLTAILRNATTNYCAHLDHRHRRIHRLDPDCRLRKCPRSQRSHASMFYRLRLGVAFTHLISTNTSSVLRVTLSVKYPNYNKLMNMYYAKCPCYAHHCRMLATSLARLDNRALSEYVLLVPWPGLQTATTRDT